MQVEEDSIFGECTTPEEIHLMVELAEQGYCKILGSERNHIIDSELMPKVKSIINGEELNEFIREFEQEDIDNYLSEKWWAEHTDDSYDEDDFIRDYIRRWENGEIWYRYESDPGDEYNYRYATKVLS